MNSPPTLRAWLDAGPFALAMSSGFFGFYAHAGALTALLDAGLVPSRAGGSSAGALVTGLWAAGLSPVALRDQLWTLRREDFWDPSPGLGLLRGRRFRAMLDALAPDAEVGATAVPWSASVFDLRARSTTVASRGPVSAAVHASCAVPVLFHPVWIDGRPYADGGIADRPGLAAIPAGHRVLHHHLASRSPWRRSGSASMALPRRPGLVAVSIADLPRLHPFALDRGMAAFDAAARAFARALCRPIADGAVQLAAGA